MYIYGPKQELPLRFHFGVALSYSGSKLRRKVTIWEFPKIRGPDIDPTVVRFLLQGHVQEGSPQFVERPQK